MSNVYIIADRSGKMSELGKDHLQTYVLHAAVDMLDSCGVQPELLAWSSGIDVLQEPDVLEHGGRADTQLLASVFSDMDRGSCVLLISDGNFSSDNISQAAAENGINVVAVYIGADADVSVMNRLSTSGTAMAAEDIAAAVAVLCGYIGQEER